MWSKNYGQTEDEILRNRFTAYLLTAIQRRRKDYKQRLGNNMEISGLFDTMGANESYEIEDQMMERLPLMMKLENEELLSALQQLGERERYVLLSRALEEKSFEMLSLELGMGYKGASAIYYRAVQKIRNRMRGGKV